MPTGPDDVPFRGKTGSSLPTSKMTRLTQNRYQPGYEVRPQSLPRLRLIAPARDRRNDRRADGAAGRLRDSRHGRHAALLHVRK